MNTGEGPDPKTVYADIIRLPHHRSEKHPHMSLHDRAAQFAPFAALSGYGDMIGEEARYVGRMEEPGEAALDILNRKLLRIGEAIRNGATPTVTVSYFVPDERKEGGTYVTVTEKIKKIDMLRRRIVLVKTGGISRTNETIDMDRISDLAGDTVEPVDTCGFDGA